MAGEYKLSPLADKAVRTGVPPVPDDGFALAGDGSSGEGRAAATKVLSHLVRVFLQPLDNVGVFVRHVRGLAHVALQIE